MDVSIDLTALLDVWYRYCCKMYFILNFFFYVQVLDYTQYYLDVNNIKGEAHWAIEYNLTQYYGLREVSPASLDALAERIRSHHDRGIFAKWVVL